MVSPKPFAGSVQKKSKILGQHHWIVKQFLMAFITEGRRLFLVWPWAASKYSFTLGPRTILGASEESFRDEVVGGCMRTTHYRRACIFPCPMNTAAT